MTKRDIAIWFCKVTCLMGLVSGLFSFALNMLYSRANFASSDAKLSLLTGFSTWSVYAFVGFLAVGIGNEIAAEGEFGEPITNKSELVPLLWRCLGFVLLLHGATAFAGSLVYLEYYHFFSKLPVPLMTRLSSQMLTGLIGSFLQGAIGFYLAFAPRIRGMLRAK